MAFFTARELHGIAEQPQGQRERAFAGFAVLAAHGLLAALLLLGVVHEVVETGRKDATSVMVDLPSREKVAALAPEPPKPKLVRVAPVTVQAPDIVMPPAPRTTADPTPSPVPVTATSPLETAPSVATAGGVAGSGADAASGAGGGGGGYDDNAYLRRVALHIQGFIKNPHQVTRSMGSPLVRLYLIWGREGMLQKVEVAQSSGYSLIDQAAMDAVWRAQPLPSIPPQMIGQEYKAHIPMLFEYHW